MSRISFSRLRLEGETSGAAQVLLVLGAGGVLGGGPAPGIGLLCAVVAPVPTPFAHLRQQPPTPAPEGEVGSRCCPKTGAANLLRHSDLRKSPW